MMATSGMMWSQSGDGLLTIPAESGVNPDCYGSVSMTSGSNLRLNGDWTIEAWIKLPAGYPSDQVHVVETYSSTASGGYVLRISNNKIMAYAMTGSSQPFLMGVNLVPGGEWVHIAAAFNETTKEMSLYLNGQLDNSGIFTGANQFTATNYLMIGARGDDQNINTQCLIDEVRIWDKARTEQEIQNTLNACLSGNETNLLAYYSFEGFDGTSFTDESGNGNDGVVVNGASQAIVDGVFDCNGTTTSIEKEVVQSDVYPNPVTDYLNIKTNSPFEQALVYDMAGRLIIQSTDDQIDLSNLLSGNYLVKVVYDNKVETHRIVK